MFRQRKYRTTYYIFSKTINLFSIDKQQEVPADYPAKEALAVSLAYGDIFGQEEAIFGLPSFTHLRESVRNFGFLNGLSVVPCGSFFQYIQ